MYVHVFVHVREYARYTCIWREKKRQTEHKGRQYVQASLNGPLASLLKQPLFPNTAF